MVPRKKVVPGTSCMLFRVSTRQTRAAVDHGAYRSRVLSSIGVALLGKKTVSVPIGGASKLRNSPNAVCFFSRFPVEADLQHRSRPCACLRIRFLSERLKTIFFSEGGVILFFLGGGDNSYHSVPEYTELFNTN